MVTGNRGASVVDLRERRIERLQHDLTEGLAAGHVVVEASEVDSVDEWRAAARAASRRAGWRVRTGITVGETHVWAARVDVDPPSWDDPRRYYPGDPADVLDTAGFAEHFGPPDPELVVEAMNGRAPDLADPAAPAIETLSLDF